MRGTAPLPLVPEMPTTSETEAEVALTADGGEANPTSRPSSDLQSDGGQRRDLPERTFGAPLVPDCS